MINASWIYEKKLIEFIIWNSKSAKNSKIMPMNGELTDTPCYQHELSCSDLNKDAAQDDSLRISNLFLTAEKSGLGF